MQFPGKITGSVGRRTTAVARRFARDEFGATTIEYGLIVGMMSVAIIAVLLSIGTTLRDDIFGVISSALSGGES